MTDKIKTRLRHNDNDLGFRHALRNSANEHGFSGFFGRVYYLLIRFSNFVDHRIARFLPFNNLRVAVHRKRGVKIGKNVQIGVDCWIEEAYPDYITIKDNAAIVFGSRLIAHSKPPTFHKNRFESYVAPIIVEQGVWVGAHSTILPGVKIGRGSVISAGSVVTKNVLPFTIVRGNPAEVVGMVRMLPEEREKYKDVLVKVKKTLKKN